MEAEIRSHECSEDQALRTSLLKYSGKYFIYKILPVLISGGDYSSQGEIVNLRGRHIHTMSIYLCYRCVIVFSRLLFLIANSYHLYMFLSSSKRGRFLEQDLFLSIILVLIITII